MDAASTEECNKRGRGKGGGRTSDENDLHLQRPVGFSPRRRSLRRTPAGDVASVESDGPVGSEGGVVDEGHGSVKERKGGVEQRKGGVPLGGRVRERREVSDRRRVPTFSPRGKDERGRGRRRGGGRSATDHNGIHARNGVGDRGGAGWEKGRNESFVGQGGDYWVGKSRSRHSRDKSGDSRNRSACGDGGSRCA